MTKALHYRITPRDPAAHLFEVRCTIPTPDPAGQRFSLPTWIPGSYLIRDFARHVVRIRAESNGRLVPVDKLDRAMWQCEPTSGPLTLISEVYAWDLSVRAAHLDATHGYFNGTSVFFQIHGRENRPCVVDIEAPVGGGGQRWRVATAMRRDGAPPHAFGRYMAADYDDLVDHPVEMGDFALATFTACGVPHDVALTGRHRADLDRLCRDLTTICEHHIRFFGEPAPFDRYVFLVTAVGEGYGGLEHRASTSLLCSREDLPKPGDREINEKYRTLLALASHEYFHAWNVKRIKPQAFIPYDLTREVYTRLLWAFEGITSYYDALALVRTGLISPASYLELVGQTVTRLLRGPGRLKQTVEESSFDAWIKFYKPDENTPNAVVSYYTKGALVASALDLTIRRETRNAKSLDDVMRALWERHGKTGVGVPEDRIERIAREVSGVDLRAFFDRALRTAEDLPLAELFADVGVTLGLRTAESDQDKGGKPGTTPHATRTTLGVRLAESGSDAKLATVHDGSAAQAAGLAAGDVIMAVDGLRATRGNLESLIGAYPPGSTVHIHAFRRDELMEFDLTPAPAPLDTCFLTLTVDPPESIRARRAAWLGG
ncbi:MAG: M61 family metallopeptidase [Nitrospirota bacterium]